jgi:hypothetical protein
MHFINKYARILNHLMLTIDCRLLITAHVKQIYAAGTQTDVWQSLAKVSI